MKLHCNCKASQKVGSQFKCRQFNENERQLLFDHFWTKSWKEKQMYVQCLIDVASPSDIRHRKDSKTSRRKNTLTFHLKKDGINLKVCKKMFLGTLGLDEWSTRKWATNAKRRNSTSPEDTQQASKSDEMKRESVRLFFESLPKVPSHYCRSSSNRLYLEPTFRSYNRLYAEYKRNAIEKGERFAGKTLFRDIRRDMKISIYRPKKDKCETCLGHQHGHVTDTIFEHHVTMKEEAREAKDIDKEEGKFVYVMDVEAVLLCPKSNASSMYYKTKLNIHNFTLYNLKNGAGHCYFWDETAADLSADVFASMLYDFISNKINFEPGDEIIFYSDGCTYQNRNCVVSNAFVYMAQKYQVTIVQKYLEKGHTQMECDSVHSAIETQFRNAEIYLPSGYISATIAARPDDPYTVEYLDHSFFQRFRQLSYYTTIRPSINKAGEATVTDIRALKYRRNGEIQFKLNHSGEWKDLSAAQRKRRSAKISTNFCNEELPNLFPSRRPIKKKKFDHLQELKAVVPADTHAFYDSIPYSI